MLKYSDLYPLSTGGGSSVLAGFEWSEKTADFVAEPNKAYYTDTALGNVLMTLPDEPANGAEVAFFIIGANALRITTEANIKGTPLATDFVRQVSENYLIIIFTYVDNSTGWDWDSRYNSFVINVYVGAGDPLFSNVILFLKGDGVNNSTSIVDSSPTPKTITRFGNTKISTEQVKYGGSSIYFDGAGDYLSITGEALGTSEFTCEMWFYCTSTATAQGVLNGGILQTSGPSWNMVINGNNKNISAYWNSYSNIISSNTNLFSLNAWNHFAFVRGSSNIRIYLNGVKQGESTTNYTNNLTRTTQVVGRTYIDYDAEYFQGYIDSLRITKGVARYTENFNPETDTFLNT